MNSLEYIYIYNLMMMVINRLLNSLEYVYIYTQKCTSEHASKAMYRLLSIFHQFEFSTAETCKLFDQLVSPVLHYSSEIWGLHTATEIENVNRNFLRKILSVRKSTNLIGLYGETGRVPLQIIRKILDQDITT